MFVPLGIVQGHLQLADEPRAIDRGESTHSHLHRLIRNDHPSSDGTVIGRGFSPFSLVQLALCYLVST